MKIWIHMLAKRFLFLGYVYRVDDLENTQFILARDMIINSSNQTVVCGFLCSYENAEEFENDTWVTITGEIEVGYYYGEIPILNILEIEECEEPESPEVYPPSDTYVSTSTIYC